jgi:hypothetical protein
MADLNRMAHRIVQHATEPRDAPAQVNGRSGDLKGGKARAAKLTPAERRQIAPEGRWARKA